MKRNMKINGYSANIISESDFFAGTTAKSDSGHSAGQGGAKEAVKISLSASSDVFKAVDSFYNMGEGDRLSAYGNLSESDKAEFLKVVASLSKSGYMGYEVLKINGQPEKHDIDMQIGDEETYDAPLYPDSDQFIP